MKNEDYPFLTMVTVSIVSGLILQHLDWYPIIGAGLGLAAMLIYNVVDAMIKRRNTK